MFVAKRATGNPEQLRRGVLVLFTVVAATLALACGGDRDLPAAGSSSVASAGGAAAGGSGAGSGGGGGSGGSMAPLEPFIDATESLGIDFVHHPAADSCTFAAAFNAGVCLFDYDGDGWLDVYFLDSESHPNRLYRNQGGSSFRDVTEETGTGLTLGSTGCLAFDADGDDDLDLYVGTMGPDRLLRNDGGVFVDATEAFGLVEDGPTSSITAGDIDGDGDLDLFVGGNLDVSTCQPSCPAKIYTCGSTPSHLFVNDGGKFVDAGAERGVVLAEPVLATVMVDFDRDGDVDLYVGNDLGLSYDDRLYINDGTGHFVDRGEEIGIAVDGAGFGGDTMGVAIGDYDRDGVFDMAVSNFEGQRAVVFHCRDPGPICVDTALEGDGLDSTIPTLNWAVGLVDFDNDGWLDLFLSNGLLHDKSIPPEGQAPPLQPQKNQLFWNASGTFSEYAPGEGSAFAIERNHRGAAFGDIDNDGDVDIVVASNGQAPQVILNQAARGGSITVALEGQSIGALVSVTAAGSTLTQPIMAGGSFLGSSDPRAHFGVGDASSADVTVRWPDGRVSTSKDVPTGQLVTLE
jgi:hypothetical protein